MGRLTRWTVAHRRIVVIGWVLLAVGLFVVSQSASGTRIATSLSIPGTDSGEAVDLLGQHLPGQSGDNERVVFHARTARLTDPDVRAAIEGLLHHVRALPHVGAVVSPFAPGSPALSRDSTIGFATVTFDAVADRLPKDAVAGLIHTVAAARTPALQVELDGRAIEASQTQTAGLTTIVGLVAAVLVLLLSFGSVLGMGIPILTALLGLGAGVAGIGLVSHLMPMASFAAELAVMIGLGVGIDYALFIVTRFRAAYADNGGDLEVAIELAMATAGRAVLFAGITVVVAMLGLMAMGLSSLVSAALASVVVVVLVLVASLTLLPALLAITGRRVGRPSRRASARPIERPALWIRVVAVVQRRRWIAAVGAMLALIVLALPLLGLRLANSDAGNDPTSQTTRRAYDLMASAFGRGFNGPLIIALGFPKPVDDATVSRFTDALRATPDVATVAAPQLNATRDTAAIVVFPASAPQDAATVTLVTHLRNDVLPPLTSSVGAVGHVGGYTATEVDASRLLADKLPLFIGVVVVLSSLFLLLVFRSLLIPVQAAVMNLLSIGASLGVSQAIFERGWLAGLIGAHPAPISAYIPVMVFAVVFGLSMDYEVFLVSRVREEWQRTNDASVAIRDGIATTGRVITAAAAVMVAVFGAFATANDPIIKLFGFTMAFAVFLDAFVIRSVLLTAVLEIAGRWTWWLPARLDRWLPRLDIEAASPRPALDEAA